MSKIAELWAKEILAGHKTEEDVPARLKSEIQVLLQLAAAPEDDAEAEADTEIVTGTEETT